MAMGDDAIKEQMKQAVANFAGSVRQCASGTTTPQGGKRRPPSQTGLEKRVRRNAWKHGYRLCKPRGQTRCALIGNHDRIVLADVTLDEVDAFLGGAPPNPYSLSDDDNEGVGPGG